MSKRTLQEIAESHAEAADALYTALMGRGQGSTAAQKTLASSRRPEDYFDFFASKDAVNLDRLLVRMNAEPGQIRWSEEEGFTSYV